MQSTLMRHGPRAGDVPDLPHGSAALRRIRAALQEAGYTETGLREALGAREVHLGPADAHVEHLRATRAPTQLNTLIRLFMLGETADAQDAATALGSFGLEDAEAAGLLGRDGSTVAARVKLMPCRGLLIASDRSAPSPSPMPADFVMGVGSSSLTLANLTVRRSGVTALDLGCGSGIQAVLAAAHSARVMATDLNPRAVAYARLNSRLNGLDNVECLEGSFFDPVRGCGFDLIVSNPPFVISPESTYIYRDGGLPADGVCRSIAREAPGYLNEDGVFQMLCNWAHVRGEDWRERIAGWFEGSGCDAWVMRCETHEPAVYASTWIRHTERSRGGMDPAQYDAWMDYYEGLGIEAISAGVVSMRRTDRRGHWFRADEAPSAMLGPCGDDVARGFALYDFLTTLGRQDTSLVEQALRLSYDARLHTELAPADDDWNVEGARLRLSRGLAYTQDLRPDLASLLVRFREGRRVGEVIQEAGVGETDLPACLSSLRGLVAQGFLLPVGPT